MSYFSGSESLPVVGRARLAVTSSLGRTLTPAELGAGVPDRREHHRPRPPCGHRVSRDRTGPSVTRAILPTHDVPRRMHAPPAPFREPQVAASVGGDTTRPRFALPASRPTKRVRRVRWRARRLPRPGAAWTALTGSHRGAPPGHIVQGVGSVAQSTMSASTVKLVVPEELVSVTLPAPDTLLVFPVKRSARVDSGRRVSGRPR